VPDVRGALRREFPPGVVLVYLLMALATTTEGTLQLLLPPYLDAYGYALPAIGVLVSLLSVMRLASRLPVGAAYGAESAKRMAVLALAGLSVATGGFAFAGGELVPVVLLTLAHGFAFGSLGTLLLAAIIDMTGGHRAGAIMAWYTAALSTGYSVGALLGGAVADAYGIATALTVVSLLPLAAIGLALALPPFHGPPRVEAPAAGLRGLLRGVARLDPRVWVAFTIVLYSNVIANVVDAFFPLFGLAIGLTLAEIGVIKGFRSAAATVIRFASLGIARWVEPAVINFWGVLVVAVATVALPLARGDAAFAILLALSVVLGLSRGILRVTTAASVAELRREGKDIGLASGVYNSGLDIGSIIGPTVGGVIAEALGIPLMFQVVAVVSLAGYFAVALSTPAGRSSLAVLPRAPRSLSAR
jgi:predicted MFS family arabinose efflux permease